MFRNSLIQNLAIFSLLSLVSLSGFSAKSKSEKDTIMKHKRPPREYLLDNAQLYKRISRPNIERDHQGEPMEPLPPKKEVKEFGHQLSEWEASIRIHYPKVIEQLADRAKLDYIDLLTLLHLSFAHYDKELREDKDSDPGTLSHTLLSFLQNFRVKEADFESHKTYSYAVNYPLSNDLFGSYDAGEILTLLFLAIIIQQPIYSATEYGRDYLVVSFNNETRQFVISKIFPRMEEMTTVYQDSACLSFDNYQGLDGEVPALVIGNGGVYREGSDNGRKCPKHQRVEKVEQLRSQVLPVKTIDNFRDFVEIEAFSFQEQLTSEINIRQAEIIEKEKLKIFAKKAEEQAILDLPENSPNVIAKQIVMAAGIDGEKRGLFLLQDVLAVLCESALVKNHPLTKDGAFDKDGKCNEHLVVRRVTGLYRLLQRSDKYSDGVDEENAIKVLSDVINIMKERAQHDLKKRN